MKIKLSQLKQQECCFTVSSNRGQPIRQIKVSAQHLMVGVIGFVGVFLYSLGALVYFHYTAPHDNQEQAEYARLQQVNAAQTQELTKLEQKTAQMQDNMNRLNALDADLRRLLNTDETQQTSRSGSGLHNTLFKGQGGPSAPEKIQNVEQQLSELQAAIQTREQSLLEIKTRINEKNARLACTPSIWPVEGEVTSPFGYRSSPFGGGSDFHPGIDIANNYGTPVHATADGVVVFAGWYNGYGNLIQVDHGYGIVSFYGHNQALLVQVGQTVKKGDIISEMGSTGLSTGPHTHYEIRVNGTAVDPMTFL
ncbi:murein DD-endopeptidase MepM/ murein hydrolase activator NlpD [Sporomusaceae bacterium BoRhaA]|uniref:M23 family metallopeptidase n=1 Tax=Pelorhabdus rhamnosifermentans TaxID=2772457 RepID=UPI001C063B5F|nr:M23 family metallopeptidase [Pelorhabdus rhamnosifermentans]MBU2703133.1 murein DD-endopeptidase MepM/ murein hydrolase activator NlpD [Pelorhabdus rhamnosifermentans]